MNESRQLLLAIGLSLLVLIGFNFLYDAPKKQTLLPSPTPVITDNNTAKSTLKSQAAEPLQVNPKRITINSDTVSGSLLVNGALIDDLSLKNYHESTDSQSPSIVLLNPSNTKNAFYLFSGWKSLNTKDIGKIPDENTVWHIDNEEPLTPTHPITMFWFNENGIKFERTIQLDDQYLFTITDKVANLSQKVITLQPFAKLNRSNPPKSSGFFILHEGPIGVFDKHLFEANYEDIQKKAIEQTTTGGWLGYTDKYWLISLIPDQKLPIKTKYSGEQDNYSIQSEATSYTIQPGNTISYTYHLFAGPKVLRILDAYEEKLGFQRFDLAVDFGWFYFLTKPLFYVLEFLHQALGNLGLAILLLTVLFKIILYPFANKSYNSMAKMKLLQPKLEQIKQRYPDDRVRMNQALMDFYKKENVNPLGGCLPMIIQAPIFFCLYKVFFVTIEMRHAPFFGWIHDLSAPDPTTFFNLFGLIPWSPPSFLQIGIWPLIMGLTMLLQQRLNPQLIDPLQAKVMLIMPIMFTYMFASFPAGLVIYWAWNNILSIAQQWIINKKQEKSFK